MRYAPLLLLLLTGPASAHDWRAARAEYGPEVCRARAMNRLDCAQLAAAVDRERQLINQQTLMEYQSGLFLPRPVSRPVAPARPTSRSSGR